MSNKTFIKIITILIQKVAVEDPPITWSCNVVSNKQSAFYCLTFLRDGLNIHVKYCNNVIFHEDQMLNVMFVILWKNALKSTRRYASKTVKTVETVEIVETVETVETGCCQKRLGDHLYTSLKIRQNSYWICIANLCWGYTVCFMSWGPPVLTNFLGGSGVPKDYHWTDPVIVLCC